MHLPNIRIRWGRVENNFYSFLTENNHVRLVDGGNVIFHEISCQSTGLFFISFGHIAKYLLCLIDSYTNKVISTITTAKSGDVSSNALFLYLLGKNILMSYHIITILHYQPRDQWFSIQGAIYPYITTLGHHIEPPNWAATASQTSQQISPIRKEAEPRTKQSCWMKTHPAKQCKSHQFLT